MNQKYYHRTVSLGMRKQGRKGGEAVEYVVLDPMETNKVSGGEGRGAAKRSLISASPRSTHAPFSAAEVLTH